MLRYVCAEMYVEFYKNLIDFVSSMLYNSKGVFEVKHKR